MVEGGEIAWVSFSLCMLKRFTKECIEKEAGRVNIAFLELESTWNELDQLMMVYVCGAVFNFSNQLLQDFKVV